MGKKYIPFLIVILTCISLLSCGDDEVEKNEENEYIYQKSDFCFGQNENENAINDSIIIKCGESKLYKWYCPGKDMPALENVFYDNLTNSHYLTGWIPTKDYGNTYVWLNGGDKTGVSYWYASFVCQGNLFTYRIKVRTIAAKNQGSSTETATE